MKILIPHLGYAVYFRPRKAFKGDHAGKSITERVSKHVICVYMDNPSAPSQQASLAHEVVHVLQYVCEGRGIDFIHEMEHTAYLAQYIINRVRGYEYDTN